VIRQSLASDPHGMKQFKSERHLSQSRKERINLKIMINGCKSGFQPGCCIMLFQFVSVASLYLLLFIALRLGDFARDRSA
jgi:hypothetical protein